MYKSNIIQLLLSDVVSQVL